MNLLRLIKLIEIFIEAPEEINVITLVDKDKFSKKDLRFLIFKTTTKRLFLEIHKELSQKYICEKNGQRDKILWIFL